MSLRFTLTRRLLLAALAGALMTLGMLSGTAAQASVLYGGLGTLGELHPVEGVTSGEPGTVVTESDHAFAVDPTDGSYFIGDSFETEAGEIFIRIQKFEASGKFAAESRIPLPFVEGFEGFAIDPATHRLYVLVIETPAKASPPELPAASELWSFSTEVENKKLKEPTKLDNAKQLHAEAQRKFALLEPRGIAVDPTTHDVLIVGQQDEPASKGEPEHTVAAVQRVHTNGVGKLGPRYVDKGNCLVEGVPTKEEEEAVAKGLASEMPCAEGQAAPFSAVVSPGGRLYTERSNELWEIPSSAGETEVFTEGEKPTEEASPPKRLFTVTSGGQQHILELAEGELGSTMTIAPMAGGTRIYLDAEVNTGAGRAAGALILGYSEEASGPEAHVIGWTGGLTESEKEANPNCVIPVTPFPTLIGADGAGHTLLLVSALGSIEKHTSEVVEIMRFGADAGASQCAHAIATPPKVEFGADKEVTKLSLGKEAKLTDEVTGANAESVEWKLKNTTTGKEDPVTPGGYEFQTPALLHKFDEAGIYEITETITPDDFGPPIEEHASLTVGEVKEVPPTVTIAPGAALTAGTPTTLTAHVTDNNEGSSPKISYQWQFGDGASEEEKERGSELKVEHTYGSAGTYEVKLKVTDHSGRSAEVTRKVVISAPASKEEHHETSGGGGTTTTTTPPLPPPPTGQVLPAKEASDPDAELAGSALSVTPQGALTVKVTCPAGQASCTGTITLRTLGAVSAAAHPHKAVLTLASASFSVPGGQVKTLTLHLSAKARKLLAHSHTLRARTTLVAHNPSGATHTAQTLTTLRLAKAHDHKH